MAPEELQPGAWHKPTLEKIIFSLKFQLPPRTRTACSRRVGGFLTPTGPFFAITHSYTRCCWLGCAECYWKWEPWSPVPAVTPPAPSLRTPSGEQGDGGGWDSCQCGRTRCIPLSCAYFGIFLFFFFLKKLWFSEMKTNAPWPGRVRSVSHLHSPCAHTRRGALSSQRSSGDAFGDLWRPHAAVPWGSANILGVTKTLLSLIPPVYPLQNGRLSGHGRRGGTVPPRRQKWPAWHPPCLAGEDEGPATGLGSGDAEVIV